MAKIIGVSTSALVWLVGVAVVMEFNRCVAVPTTSGTKVREVTTEAGQAPELPIYGVPSTTATTTTSTSTTTTTTTAAVPVAPSTPASVIAATFPTAESPDLISSSSTSTTTTTTYPPPTPVVLAFVEEEEDLRTPAAAASEHVVSTVPSSSGIVELGETQVIDAIQKGLTKLKTSGERLRKFVEKIEVGIQTGAISKTIEDVKTKIESGKVDLHKLVAAYKQKSPLTFDELIKRISEDSHVLLDKLHGKIESLSLSGKVNVPAGQNNNKSDELAVTYEHPSLLLFHPEPETKATLTPPALSAAV